MADEKDTTAGNEAPEDKEPVVVVDDETLAKRGAEATDDGADDDHDDDDSDDQDEGEGTDKRAGHAEGEQDGEDATATTNRKRNQERKRRQREARERMEREVSFLRSRNEQLERRFSTVEARQILSDKGRIQSEMQRLDGLLEQAKEAKAAAVAAAAGEDVVEADEIIADINHRKSRLQQAQERLEQAPARRESTEMPPAARKAVAWVRKNQSWYKPDGSTEDSAVAQAVEGVLLREGYNPHEDAYWTELDRRLERRLPHVFKKARRDTEVDSDEDDEDEDERPASRRERQPQGSGKKPASGGPRVSVGGQNVRLKPGEMYISPERRKAMEEAGVWDDPVLRDKQLKAYRRYDRENGLI